MNAITPENVTLLDGTTWLVILSAVVIMGFILFVKTIKATLKIAVILVMLLFIAYFLRQSGMI